VKQHWITRLGIALSFSVAASTAQAQGGQPSAAVAQAGKVADSTATPAPEPIPNFFKDVTVNAFTSMGYGYNANRPADRVNGLRIFDRTTNSFQVDVAEVVLQKTVAKTGDVGFRVDLEAGSSIPGVTQSAGLAIGTGADLQQAFLSYVAPVGSGLRLDFGKFVTCLGIEVIEGYDGYNDNYSRSLLFNYAIPLTHTGVKAGYTFSPMVSATAMIVNGWDVAVDNNSGKSVGLQLALVPAAPVAILLNYMGGPEQANSNSIRHVGDIVATYKVSEMLSLGINGDYAVEKGASAVTAGQDAKWSGVAGYVKVTTDPRFFISLRAETFKDEGGTRLGLGMNTTANEFTVTPTMKVSSNFLVRAEGRYDSVNQNGIFADDKAVSKKNQATIGLNAIFVY
jgi:hypothetical protein